MPLPHRFFKFDTRLQIKDVADNRIHQSDGLAQYGQSLAVAACGGGGVDQARLGAWAAERVLRQVSAGALGDYI